VPGTRDAQGGPVWRAKPKIARHGRDIGGTCGIPSADSSGGMWDAGEGLLEGLGDLEHDMHKRGGDC
jgi:hypothetical protein